MIDVRSNATQTREREALLGRTAAPFHLTSAEWGLRLAGAAKPPSFF